MIKFLVLILLASFNAQASSTRTVDADTIRSSDATKSYPLPSTATTLAGRTDTATLTNKTIAGDVNTLSKLPVQSQVAVDSFYGNGSTTAFTLSNSIISTSGVTVFLDGAERIITTDYTISGTSLTFTSAPVAGQKITVRYSIY